MVDLDTFQSVDIAIIGVLGAVFILGLLAAILSVPWNRKRWINSGAMDLNKLYPSRVVLAVIICLWMAATTIPLTYFWGINSFFLSDSSKSWVAQGWLCRIYLTTSLGILGPFTAWLVVFILATGTSRPSSGDLGAWDHHQTRDNLRVIGKAVLVTLPIALGQAVIAWLSAFLEYKGVKIERHATDSVLGYFFGTYVFTNDAYSIEGNQECAVCIFPAAAVILQLVWTVPFIITVWIIGYGRLARRAGNFSLQQRLYFFCWVITLLMLLGVGAIGASIGFKPVSWVYQGLWIGYVTSTVLISLLILLVMVIVPSITLLHLSRKIASTKPTDSPLAANTMFDSSDYYAMYAAPAPPGSSRPIASTIDDLAADNMIPMNNSTPVTMSSRTPTPPPLYYATPATTPYTRQQQYPAYPNIIHTTAASSYFPPLSTASSRIVSTTPTVSSIHHHNIYNQPVTPSTRPFTSDGLYPYTTRPQVSLFRPSTSSSTSNMSLASNTNTSTWSALGGGVHHHRQHYR